MDYHELTFGAEIELTGITRKEACKIISKFYNSSCTYEGGGYELYSAFDDLGRKWQVERDGSIATEKKINGRVITAGGEYSVEVVTPILHYSDIDTLQELVRLLRKAGAFPNKSTGVHIHIGVGYEIDAKKLSNLFKMFYSKQDLIYEALNVGESRRRYCNKLSDLFINNLNSKKPATISEIKDVWYDGFDRGGRYNHTRYRGINAHPLLSQRMPTIEYRIFQFSNGIHAGELKSFIQFAIMFTAYGLNSKSTSSKRTIPTGSHKYAFRVFLLKLGFIGDEFKTARQHLIKNLSGSAAWHDIA